MNRCLSRLFLSFVFLLIYFAPSYSQGPAANGNGKQLPRYMVNPDALNTPQFKAMVEEAEGFLNNLSEDEMKEFMGFYEEFLKGVENGEIDLNEYLPEGILQPLTPEQAEALIAEEQAPTSAPAPTAPVPAAPITAIEDVNDAIAMLNAIIEYINSIFNKAESDPTISDSLTPWKERLHKLVVYLQLLSQKKHVQRLLADAEHKGVLDILKELNQQLAIYEPQITVPEFGIGILQKQEKEVSKRALQKSIEAISTAITNKELMQKIEKIFAQYEPEALKKAQDMLAAQERAKRPVPTVSAPSLAPTSIETKHEVRRHGRERYEPSFEMPEYYGAGRREQPSFWGGEEPGMRPGEMPKAGPGAGVTGAKPKKTAEEEKKEKEKAEKEAKDKKAKDTEKDKGKKKPAPTSKETEKLLKDIEKRIDDVIDELPDKKDTDAFVADLLDPDKATRSFEKLNKVNVELGNINRKYGQFKALSKEAKGDASAELDRLIKKLATRLSSVYTEFKGVELPKKMDDIPQAQSIDTFVKTTELVFPNFRSITPTTKRKMKQPKKVVAEEEISEEEIEEAIPSAPVIAPAAVPAKATVVTPATPMQAQYTIRQGAMPVPQTAEYVPTAPMTQMPTPAEVEAAEFDWMDVD